MDNANKTYIIIGLILFILWLWAPLEGNDSSPYEYNSEEHFIDNNLEDKIEELQNCIRYIEISVDDAKNDLENGYIQDAYDTLDYMDFCK